MASRTPARLLVAWRALRNSARPGRRHAPSAPRRILVAHHLLLGDTLMLTPLLAKLRAHHPEAQIAMTTRTGTAPLYQGRPYGVEALPYDLRDLHSVRALLRQPAFDLAFVPGDNRYSWIARAMDARWIVAFAGDRPAYKSWPVDQLLPYPDRPAAWSDMVAELVPGEPVSGYDPGDWPDPPHALFDFPPSPYCVLHVGASSPLKLWEPPRWAALAEELAARGLGVVWSGGRGEQALVDRIDPDGRFPSHAGRLDLPQLWHLIRRAGLLVSPDTGIAHMGRLTGTPTVVLFGPGSHVLCGGGDFWRDAPARVLTVDPFPCRDQRLLFKREVAWVRRCQRGHGTGGGECSDNRCMKAHLVEQVVNAAADLLEP